MLRSIIVFVLVLVALNALFALLNLDIRISIVGSLVLSALVGLIMELVRRRYPDRAAAGCPGCVELPWPPTAGNRAPPRG